MDHFARIRKIAITALFADDTLVNRIVLKGGSALSLVYEIGRRTSLDLDFSLEADFDDQDGTRERIFHTLLDRFDSEGFAVFDLRFEPKPVLDGPDTRPWWGGYVLSFKLMEKAKHRALAGRPEKMQREALVVGPGHLRTFSVDFSKHEFTQGKAGREIDYFTIYVYTLPMIAIEKLRAICQQMPEYALRQHGRPRARDFYDIHLIVATQGVDLLAPANRELVRNIFAAKKVPLHLLANLDAQREFHRPDWPQVRDTVAGELGEFDFYFDFVLAQTVRLEPLWNLEPPL